MYTKMTSINVQLQQNSDNVERNVLVMLAKGFKVHTEF